MSLNHFLQQFAAGTKIFTEGDPGDCAYLIEDGRIAINTFSGGQEVTVATLGPGEIFGEMAILDGLQRSASAKALENSTLMVIHRDQLFEHLKNSNPVVKLLFRILLKRIRETNRKLFSDEDQKKFFDIEKTSLGMQREMDILALDRIRLESELKEALDKNEFSLRYQPIVDINKNNEVCGYEALIRWQSPKRGFVSPDIFMQIMEETSMIIPLGSWIFEKSLVDFQQMQKKNPNLQFISINISGRQLENELFLPVMEKIREKIGVPTKNIKFEITERIFCDGSHTAQIMSDCRQYGYSLSIDDFGTGYSNLLYLSKFDFDSLKIDRSFVKSLFKDQKKGVLFQGIVNIAKGLGFKVIAEGIETDEEFQEIKQYGVDYAQGYLFGKPAPLSDL